MDRKVCIFFLLSFIWCGHSIAQDSISVNDAAEIKFRAKALIANDLSDLLNGISNTNTGSNDADEMIMNSYSSKTNKIFLSPETIIENDINPSVHSGSGSEDLKVKEYLTELDIKYKKSDQNSIVLFDINPSNVKKTSSIYIKVYFTSIFKNPHKYIDTAYTMNNRVAELKVEKSSNNKWEVLISRIGFLTAADSMNDNSTDITLTNEKDKRLAVTDTSSIVNEKSFDEKLKEEKEKELIEENEEATKQFKSFMSQGDMAQDQNDFTTALSYYKSAGDLKPYDPLVRAKINNLNIKMSALERTNDQLFKDNIQNAQLAEKEREYDKALSYYNEAFKHKPEEKDKYENHLQELSTRYNEIFELSQKYKIGQYQEAIAGYDDIIKKSKKDEDIKKMSDYYMERGKCYDKLNDYDKALKDFNLACTDIDNLQALKLRADLYNRHNEFIKSLTDYNSYLISVRDEVKVYIEMSGLRLKINPTDESTAISDLTKGLSINPKAAELYYNRGLLEARTNDNNTATADFSTTIYLDSNNAAAFYNRGKCELAMNLIDKSSIDFKASRQKGLDAEDVKSIESFAENFYNLSINEFNKANKDSAIVLIGYAIAICPANSVYHFKRGEYFFNLDNYKEAILSYSRAIDLNNLYAAAYYERGLCYYFLNDYSTAINNFNSLVKIDPEHYLAFKGLGYSYFALNDYDRASHNFEKCLQIINTLKESPDPNIVANIYNALGKSYSNLTNYADAIQAFKNALKKNKNLAEAYFNKGVANYKSSQVPDAMDDFKKAIDMDSKHFDWYYQLSIAYQSTKDYTDAISNYTNCIRLDSAGAATDAIYFRGYCNYELASYPDAVKDYLKYKTLHSNLPVNTFNYELGNIYFNLNVYDSALAYYNQAYISDSTNGHIMYGIASCHFFLNKTEEALVWYDKAFQTKMIAKKDIKKEITPDRIYDKLIEEKDSKKLLNKYRL